MLQNLVNLVESKCQFGRFPEDFRQQIYSQRSFNDAYMFIENYSRQRNVMIPPNLTHLGMLSPHSIYSNENSRNIMGQSLDYRSNNGYSKLNGGYLSPRDSVVKDKNMSYN